MPCDGECYVQAGRCAVQSQKRQGHVQEACQHRVHSALVPNILFRTWLFPFRLCTAAYGYLIAKRPGFPSTSIEAESFFRDQEELASP